MEARPRAALSPTLVLAFGILESSATCDTTAADAGQAVDGPGVLLDFAHLKRQLPMARVLD